MQWQSLRVLLGRWHIRCEMAARQEGAPMSKPGAWSMIAIGTVGMLSACERSSLPLGDSQRPPAALRVGVGIGLGDGLETARAELVAVGIPGAGAITQVGTFHLGGPFHDNAAFAPA